jgi:hypothetical protein
MTDLEPFEPRLDIDEMVSGEALEVLTKGSDEKFVELADTLDVDEMSDAVAVLSHLSMSSSLRAGYLLYRIREEVQDGEWGQKIWEFANSYQVSQRTIHRWMVAAQEHFGFELTPAQRNARSRPRPEPTPEAGGEEAPAAESPFEGLEDEDPFEDLDLDELEGISEDGRSLLDWMNDEAGWGDASAPKPQRGTPEDTPAPAPRTPAVEPDPTWVEFTARSIQQEHEGYGDQAAARTASARWSRLIQQDPLGLLEDLEMIYEAHGEGVPDSIVEALHRADEEKPIVPDEVAPPKKARGGKKVRLAYDEAERILVSMRELHGRVYNGLKDGTMSDREAAGMLNHLKLMPHAVRGLTGMAEEAKVRALADGGSTAEKIAETQQTEAAPAAGGDDDPGF